MQGRETVVCSEYPVPSPSSPSTQDTTQTQLTATRIMDTGAGEAGGARLGGVTGLVRRVSQRVAAGARITGEPPRRWCTSSAVWCTVLLVCVQAPQQAVPTLQQAQQQGPLSPLYPDSSHRLFGIPNIFLGPAC